MRPRSRAAPELRHPRRVTETGGTTLGTRAVGLSIPVGCRKGLGLPGPWRAGVGTSTEDIQRHTATRETPRPRGTCSLLAPKEPTLPGRTPGPTLHMRRHRGHPACPGLSARRQASGSGVRVQVGSGSLAAHRALPFGKMQEQVLQAPGSGRMARGRRSPGKS